MEAMDASSLTDLTEALNMGDEDWGSCRDGEANDSPTMNLVTVAVGEIIAPKVGTLHPEQVMVERKRMES